MQLKAFETLNCVETKCTTLLFSQMDFEVGIEAMDACFLYQPGIVSLTGNRRYRKIQNRRQNCT